MSFNLRNPALPESFPLWPGLMSGAVLLGLGFLLGPFPDNSFFTATSLWVSAVTLFYLVTLFGNYIRIKRQYDSIPSKEIKSLSDAPTWFQQSVSLVYETAKTKIHTEKDLLDAVGAAVNEMRAGLQWRVGWIHLLPLAAVAIACVMAVGGESTQLLSADAYIPLQIASIEAVFCFILMYLFVTLSNSMLEAWNATVKQIVIRLESTKWGASESGATEWDGTGVDVQVGKDVKDSGELKVQSRVAENSGNGDDTPENETNRKSDSSSEKTAEKSGHWNPGDDEDDSTGGYDDDDPFGTGDL